MNIYDMTTKALANRRDQIEELENLLPFGAERTALINEDKRIKRELERRDALLTAECHARRMNATR